jgi:F-box domain
MSSQLKLLDLPVEILSEILSQLDHIHILRCSAVRTSVLVFSEYGDSTLTHTTSSLRFASSSTPSLPHPSLSNTASNSPLMGS